MIIDLDDLDTPIYRILSLERLLEFFVSPENALVKPEKWGDVFENLILKSRSQSDGEEGEYLDLHNQVFGQCWTLERASDAMWRIYSPRKDGLRIKSTVRKVFHSPDGLNLTEWDQQCCIGKVEYCTDERLMQVAETTFDGSSIEVEKLFKSLLIKRNAFKHESEIRLLFHDFERSLSAPVFRYAVDPHELVDQIMVDPRRSYSEFRNLKEIIRKATRFEKDIKRSLLYTLPKEHRHGGGGRTA